jgi:hypothetical protein
MISERSWRPAGSVPLQLDQQERVANKHLLDDLVQSTVARPALAQPGAVGLLACPHYRARGMKRIRATRSWS